MNLFGTDGVRGVVNEELTPELAFKIGNAIARIYEGDSVLIAKDTRKTGDMLESALASGLASAGKDVLLCGVIPTPALALLSNRLKTVGVMISASHNPPEYNGIKVIKNGFKLPDDEERRIEKLVESPKLVEYMRVGKINNFEKASDIYINEILKMFSNLNLSGMRITVDVANGAAYRTTPEVLRKLGATVDVVADKPDGFNINDGCGSTNIDFVSSRKNNGEIAFAHDGDADRCIFVDESGREFHGDKIMGTCAVSMLNEGRLKNAKVVATILSNLGLEEFLRSHGISLIRTKVGDRYVLEEMIKNGSLLGGERSGHVIFLDRSTTGDGLITALEVLRVLKRSRRRLENFNDMIPDYPQVMVNVKVNNKSVASDPRVMDAVKNLQSSDVRIIVRPSGTEPVVRVMVEGKDELKIKRVAENIAKVIEDVDAERSS